MKTGFLFMAVAGLALASAPLGAAQLYQWKDAAGRTVYSDQPPPPNVRTSVQKVFKGNLIESGESYSTKTAREKNPVTLYASACGAPCDQARQLLTERGVPFSGKDPQASPEAQAELKKVTGRLSVPVLVVGSNKIDGFEAGQWQEALDRAGYPKSAPSGPKSDTNAANTPPTTNAAPVPTAPAKP
ncbi:MAG: glutaredoxin family protein [Thiobacillus sp.]|nr:glutaredoxin family protein [Thiobacillus sp.]